MTLIEMRDLLEEQIAKGFGNEHIYFANAKHMYDPSYKPKEELTLHRPSNKIEIAWETHPVHKGIFSFALIGMYPLKENETVETPKKK